MLLSECGPPAGTLECPNEAVGNAGGIRIPAYHHAGSIHAEDLRVFGTREVHGLECLINVGEPVVYRVTELVRSYNLAGVADPIGGC